MGKDYDLLQLVRAQDAAGIFKLLHKNGRSVKTKLIGSNKKLNINYQDGDGMSALHQAALMGTTEIMQLLLENGAVVGLKDNKGMVALHYAAWQGKMDPVEVLLMWGSPVNELALNGESPLHLACQHGHYEVVKLLLSKHADPSMLSKHQKTPLDLACEFGRYRVSGLLINSNVCQRLLLDNNDEMLNNKKTTCLHLAAKNGHSDIIRLLLQAGVNINCCTPQGTCLHEAAMYGKTDVVSLLLDCGADVNKPNSYDQTALDIVNKFTTTRAAKDLKLLLKEASFAVQARAIKDHFNTNDSNSLPFKDGDYIIVLEQKPDGLWKGHVMNDGKTSKSGYFPSDHVVLVDSQAIAKSQRNGNPRRVPSPQVPDLITRSPGYNQPDRSSYGSIGTDESFPPPPSPLVQAKSRDHLDSVHGTPPPPYPGCNGQQYPNKLSANHIGNHVEWNGSLTANGDIRSSSPGKDSPTGSNRNSAASSDSGRGVSTGQLETKHAHSFVNVYIANHRLSGQSYESGVSSRQSYHSTSSSSLGSLDRLEESGYSSQVNVAELVSAGLPDCEVLLAWLRDLHFEDYFNNFYQAGYDMPTISRMTPEDLTAIGVTKPGHRKRLKSEIGKLHIHDGIPDHKPNDLMDWLRLLSLTQYHDTLSRQGYADIDFVTEITWEDLEEIGIKKLGHQKKIMLAIGRLKRITIGAKRLSSYEHNKGSVEMLEPPPIIPMEPIADSLQHNQDTSIAAIKPRSVSGDNINSVGLLGPDMKTFLQKRESERISGDFTRHNSNSGLIKPEMVAIQVKGVVPRSSTTEALSEGTDMAGKVITYESFQSPGGRKMSASSDSSDAVFDSPTIPEEPEDTAVAPRPSASIHPRVVIKPKPVAKIVAKTKRSSREYSPEIISIEKHEAENNSDGLKTSPLLNAAVVPNNAPKLLSPTDGKVDRAKLSPSAEIIIQMAVSKEQEKVSPTPLSPSNGNKSLSVTIPKQNSIYDQPSVPPPKSPKPNILPKTFAGGQPLGSPGHLNQGSVSPKFAPSLGSPISANSGMVSPVFVCTQAPNRPHSPQKVSPTGKGKRIPPPPPKRTNSMQYESAIINTNEMRKANNSFGPTQTAPISNANELRKVNSFSSGVPSAIVNANELRKVNSFSPTPPTFKMIHADAKRQQESLPLRHPENTFSPPHIARKPANLNASPQIRPSPLNKVPSQDTEVPQQQAFATCVQSLSKRFGKNRDESGSQELSPSDSEDIPPSPPPVAMEIITPKLHNYGIPSKLSDTANGMASRPGKPEIKSKPISLQSRKVLESENSTSENKRTAESERRRNESPKFESNNSLSGSVDSNTLPFANENVGTIKQRNAQNKPSVVQFEDTDGDKTVTLNSTMFGENCGTLKRTYNSCNNTSMPPEVYLPSAHTGMVKPPVPMTYQPVELEDAYFGGMPVGLSHPAETGDVLNDIDNMLQGLTEELDAMLDLE